MSEIILEIDEVPYTQVAKQVVWDKDLSMKAVGLFTVLRAYGDIQKKEHRKIKINYKILAQTHTDGIESVKAAAKELKEKGYLEISAIRQAGRISGWKWRVKIGNLPEAEKTHVETSAQLSPDADLPHVEKPATGKYASKRYKDIKKINMSKGSSMLGSKLYTRISKDDFKRLAETLKNLTGKISFEEILETLIDKSIEFIFIENDSRIRKNFKKNILDVDKSAVIESVLTEFKPNEKDKPFQVIEKIYLLTCEKLALNLSHR